ncbi:acyltransferase family protein [Methylovirgula sp. 4M-Z18]|uniref:acyltransferase family protein n=1 Tax=Methylovirgula sp. 4M-Z18 TaxID=2293567 RepID=UPI0013146CEE|nr:acyltransferase family protein [Methylovirgula sp. 4M-Z18]
MTGKTEYHRPDIDGLRAVAVIPVILYHALPRALPGGFIGVDIFFVISGFLISRHIFQELDARAFSLAGFYGRRVRRIFPALIVVLFASLAYGFVVMLPSELAQLGKDALGGAGFLSNILLWQESGYFDRVAIFKPLLHLWSLGVEEQFYIFWPLFLIIISKLNRNRFYSIAAITALSFVANIYFSRWNITADFYSPFTRLWELACGGIVAYLSLYATGGRPANVLAGSAWIDAAYAAARKGYPDQKSLGIAHASNGLASGRDTSRIGDVMGWVALAVIVAACGLMNPRMTFPGWWAALPVGAAAAIIYAGPYALVNRTILAHRVATAIGVISYPLYLWHWPLISFAYMIRDGRPLKPLAALGILAVSFALSWLTYVAIEKRFRFRMNRRISAIILVGTMSAAGVAGATVWLQGGFAGRYANDQHLQISKLNAAVEDGVFQSTKDMTRSLTGDIEVSKIGSGASKVLFVGDSVVYQYGPRVQELYDEGRLDKTVYFVVGRACAPVPDIKKPHPFEHCHRFLEILDKVMAENHIDTVVLGSLWALETDTGVLVRDGKKYVPVKGERGTSLFYEKLRDEVTELIKQKLKVYLILSPPTYQGFDPREMVRRSLLGVKINTDLIDGAKVSELREFSADANNRLAQIARETGAVTLDPLPDICGAQKSCSPFFDEGIPKFADSTHLRPSFVATHITFLDDLLTDGAKPLEQK